MKTYWLTYRVVLPNSFEDYSDKFFDECDINDGCVVQNGEIQLVNFYRKGNTFLEAFESTMADLKRADPDIEVLWLQEPSEIMTLKEATDYFDLVTDLGEEEIQQMLKPLYDQSENDVIGLVEITGYLNTPNFTIEDAQAAIALNDQVRAAKISYIKQKYGIE